MLRNAPTIDADARKIENPVVFLDAVAAPWRERLRVVRDGHGSLLWEIADRDAGEPFWRRFPCAHEPSGGAAPFGAAGTGLGACFQRLRRADMDREGIDVQVIYPTLALAFSTLCDAELATALCRAYNDYVQADCAAARERCVPVGVVALQDPAAAAEELRRCVVELDMPAVALPPGLAPTSGVSPALAATPRRCTSLAAPALAALYETAEYLDAAVIVHAGALAQGSAGSATQTLLAARCRIPAVLAELIAGGVFERFARLRFGFFGAGCGWLPDFVFALAARWRARGDSPLSPSLVDAPRFAFEALREAGVGGFMARQKRLRALRGPATRGENPTSPGEIQPALAPIPAERNPEEYFARGQIFFSVSPDDPAPAALRQAFGPVGERLACWASGYGGGGDGGAFDGCVTRTSSDPQIGLDYVERILSRNARRLYGPRLERRVGVAPAPGATPRSTG